MKQQMPLEQLVDNLGCLEEVLYENLVHIQLPDIEVKHIRYVSDEVSDKLFDIYHVRHLVSDPLDQLKKIN